MEPLLLDVPRELRTDRLLLRVPAAGDGPMVARSVVASIAELTPWMPWAKDYKAESAEIWCRRSAGRFLLREQFHFVMLQASDGTHIGSLGLFAVDWLAKKCEMGYWLATPHSGKGYMTEAVQALTRYAFQSLAMLRVEIDADVRNTRSRGVAERCGYTLEGTLRSVRLDTAGLPYDSCVYAQLSQDVLA